MNTITCILNGTEINYQITEGNYPNCKIIDSYKITSRKAQNAFVAKLLDEHSLFQQRSVKSYVREWRAHNVLFGWGIEEARTKDVDLNVNETGFRRFCYFFLSLLPQPTPKTTTMAEEKGEKQE